MKNKNTNKNSKFPFSNEMKQAKYEFKRMIDTMPDEEFAIFMLNFIEWVEDLDEFADADFVDYNEDVDELEDLPF